MYKFAILVACLAYANAGVITGEHSLVEESLALNAPLSYGAAAPIARSSLSLGPPILGSSPLTLQAAPIYGSESLRLSAAPAASIFGSASLAHGSHIRSALISVAQTSISAPLALHAASQQTIRSAPLALSQGGLLNSAALSYAAPASSILRSAPLAHGSLNTIRSAAPLTVQAAPGLSHGSLNIIRSAPFALQAAPALSHGFLNIIRSAPLTFNAGW